MARNKRNRNKNRQKPNVRIIQSGERDRAIVAPETQSRQTLAQSGGQTDNSPYGSQVAAPPLMGGRQTQPTNVNPLGLLAYSFIPRRQWQGIDLTDLTSASTLTAQQLLELLADISPEVSQATWNEVRLVNGGWSVKVMTANKTRELKSAQEDLETVIENINKDYGGLDAIINSWTITAFLQGAVAGEIALTEDLDGIQDIYPVQPWTIYFIRDGQQNLVPFQQQVLTSAIGNAQSIPNLTQGYGVAGYPFKRLNPVTFGYIPLDNTPDDPYGRAPAAPSLQMVPFHLQLLKDLRQSVHMSAWGRLEITVLEDSILKNAPPKIAQSPDAAVKRNFVNEQIAAIVQAYNQLKADDVFVHTDVMKMDGVDFSGKTLQVQPIIRIVQAELYSALKQLPILMGSNEGTTETHGTVQMEIYARGIRSIQRTIANLLEKLLTVALQVLGYGNAVALVEFEPPRANDLLKDIQADSAKADLLIKERDQGWITNDQASIEMTGSKAVADPKPAPAPQQPQQQNQDDSQSQEDNQGDKGNKGKGNQPKKPQDGEGDNPDNQDGEEGDKENA